MLTKLFLMSSQGLDMSNWIMGVPTPSTDPGKFFSVFEDTDGSSVIGMTWGAANEFVLLKISTSGNIEEWKNITNTAPTYYGKLTKHSDGNILICAQSGSNTFNSLIKITPDLSTITLNKSVGTTSSTYNGRPFGVAELSTGSLILTNVLSGTDVVSVNSTATTINWSNRYTSNGLSITPSTLIKHSDDSLYISGVFTESSKLKSVIFKINSSGVVQWGRAQESASGNVASLEYGRSTVCVDDTGSVYLCGTSVTNTRAYIIKYSASGVFQWQRYITLTAASTLPGALAYGDGYVYFTFNSAATTTQIFKYDLNGNIVWKRQFYISGGSNTSGAAKHLQLSNDGQSLFFMFYTSWPTSTFNNAGFNVFSKIPVDGTGAGIYGGLTYEESLVAEGIGELTLTSPTISSTVPTYYAGGNTARTLAAGMATHSIA